MLTVVLTTVKVKRPKEIEKSIPQFYEPTIILFFSFIFKNITSP